MTGSPAGEVIAPRSDWGGSASVYEFYMPPASAALLIAKPQRQWRRRDMK
jgi:hypothetical protein